jgi:hypothetical protein
LPEEPYMDQPSSICVGRKKERASVIKRLVSNSDVQLFTNDEYREIDIKRRPIEKNEQKIGGSK